MKNTEAKVFLVEPGIYSHIIWHKLCLSFVRNAISIGSLTFLEM